MACDRSMGGLGFDGLAIGSHENRRHESQRPESLCHSVGLHITVIVLAGPHVTAMPLERAGHHIVDQPVLVGESLLLITLLVFCFEHLGENVFELAVVGLENRVLRGEVHGVVPQESIVEACACEAANRFIEIVLHLRHAAPRIIEHHMFDRPGAVIRGESHGESARSRHLEVGGLVLVAERVTSHHNRLCPTRHQTRNVVYDNRLAEDRTTENVANGAVRRLPHFLEAELLHTRLVGGYRGAFDTHMFALDRFCRVDGHLVIRGVAVLDSQVVIVEIDVEIRQYETILDVLPDDACHLVAVELNHLAFDLDFGHAVSSSRCG